MHGAVLRFGHCFVVRWFRRPFDAGFRAPLYWDLSHHGAVLALRPDSVLEGVLESQRTLDAEKNISAE